MKKINLLVIVFLLSLNGLFVYMLFQADLSLQPVDQKYIEDTNPRLPVYLISYADGHEVFFKNQHALAYSAQNKGFDVIINYRKAILNHKFREKYQDILTIKSGAGLWLWKPQILLQTMEQAPQGALIVYTDVGFIIRKDVSEIQQNISENDVLLMNIDEYATKEKLMDWLPKKIADEWKLDRKNQPKFIESGIIAVKNTPKARQFLEKWRDICARRDYAFLEYDRSSDHIKGFTYDQSLLSLVAHRYPEGVKVIPKDQMKSFTVFHHRHPGNNKPILILQVLPLKQIRDFIGTYFPSLFMFIGF